MQHEPGDEYLRRISGFIRTHEQALAQAGLTRRRRTARQPEKAPSVFNPLGWFDSSNTNPSAATKPIVLSLDTHHLFYILMRLEALDIDVGTLDVQVDSPSRPMNYINLFPDSDKSDTISLASFRSSLSAVSGLSLGASWWGRPEPLSVDVELKYIYSSFTKLPALSINAPGPKLIAELANEPPNENALPLDAFKNLQSLECLDIDPRTLLGWDKLAEGLRSLTVKRSGLEDVSDIFIGAVMDDQARREGSTSRSRRRRIPRGPSRQSSFYSTQLPETVTEDDEETPTVEKDTPLPGLSSLKWAFLRHLSLADNALTFFPTDVLPHLTSLTHLDLSSNLLVSVPSTLGALYNLVSLNLADNMIDSVLGIYTHLGQVLSLNLAHNRLESICGLERLLALERVDLRHNVVEESAEIGRLATLPHIAEVWVEGNPLVDIEENYRIACFDYFWRDGKNITLDGTPPGFYERRGLTVLPPEQMSSSRPLSTAYSPPVVAVGNTAHHSPAAESQKTPQLSPEELPPTSHDAPSPRLAAAKARRKKTKRIVELDGHYTEQSDGSGTQTGPYHRVGTDDVARHRKTASKVEPTSSALPEREEVTPRPAEQPVEPASTSSPARRSRHSRYYTEFAAPTSNIIDDEVASLPGSLRGPKALTGKSAARRARMSASVYEPPAADADEQVREAEAYRARIEALRTDMGDGWLKVFTQSQMGSAGVPS